MLKERRRKKSIAKTRRGTQSPLHFSLQVTGQYIWTRAWASYTLSPLWGALPRSCVLPLSLFQNTVWRVEKNVPSICNTYHNTTSAVAFLLSSVPFLSRSQASSPKVNPLLSVQGYHYFLLLRIEYTAYIYPQIIYCLVLLDLSFINLMILYAVFWKLFFHSKLVSKIHQCYCVKL